jgi:hypothetical protein
VHWSWTATVFIGTGLSLTTVVVLLAFIMLSVACLGVAQSRRSSASYISSRYGQ